MTATERHESYSRDKPKRPFMCGVCEGFYGKPWTTDQRKDLFYKMQKMGMTTFLYAPKDDYKHRLYWRHLYTRDEADKLTCIIQAAIENEIDFVYALSPGLDVIYSNEEDLHTIQAKLEQVSKFGCKSFALLFDDIDTDLRPEDEKKYGSLGAAQAALTNAIYEQLPIIKTFLFCPTEYCTTRACPDVKSSKYMRALGEILNSNIDIMWTGNKVVSRRLHVDEMKEVEQVLQRPPVIWDNLHANDYDQTRLYLGPYDGRPPNIQAALRGVLTNPNCEYNLNFVAFHTLAQWSQNLVTRFFVSADNPAVDDVEMKDGDGKSCPDAESESPQGYVPGPALVAAVTDWLSEFYKPKGTHPKILQEFSKLETVNLDTDEEAEKGDKSSENSPQGSKEGKKDTYCDNEAMETDDKQNEASGRKSGPHRKVDEVQMLNVRDLLLLCDLFFLPYEYGPRAMMMLSDAHWTMNNLNLIQNCRRGPGGPPIGDQPESSREWFGRAMRYHDNHKDVAILVDKLVNIPNRELLYELYCYISDMRSILSMVNSYIKWNGLGRPHREPFQHGDQEPWVNRGGLQSEFRRILPFEGQNDIFPRSQIQGFTTSAKVYTIRPYEDTDKDAVYTISRMTFDDGFDGSHMFPDQPELTADEALGGLLAISSDFCMVVEDESGVCGYALATPDIKVYQERWAKEWVPQMRKKYPMPFDMSPDSDSLSPSQELIATFHSCLRTLPEKLSKTYPGFIHMAYISSRLTDRSVPNRCLSVVARKLKKAGVMGMHTVCSADHINTIAGHINLGFEDITDEDSPDDMVVLAKRL